MDDSIMDGDCSVKVLTPMKQKKMKQARLPFQLLSTADTPNSVSKKRKLTSPSVEHKTPKIVKIAKENSAKNIALKDIEIVDEQNTHDSTETMEMSNNEDKQKLDTLVDDSTPKRVVSKRRSDGKSIMAGALAKFFRKSDSDKSDSHKEENSETDKAKDDDHGMKEEKSKTGKAEKNNDDKMEENFEIDKVEENETDNEEDKDNKEKLATKIDDEEAENDEEVEAEEEDDDDEEDEEDQSTSVQSSSQNVAGDSDADATMISSDNEAMDEENRSVLSITPKADRLQHQQEKKLTPKQLEKRLESAKKREERAKLKMEKEKKREEERENKRKYRELKRKEKEEKEQAEKEQRRKEKEMKELKKQMDIEQKQKEKEAKEEERRKKEEAREEEKRKKEEEKLELERKKQKAASNFASFFVAKKQEAKSCDEENDLEVGNFMPFEVKADMRVAPLWRRTLSKEEKELLDEKCEKGDAGKNELYIEELRSKKVVPRRSTKTWKLEAKDDIVILDEESDESNVVEETEPVPKHRVKLLQFVENRRPPYWGTWRKVSKRIKARTPFYTDSKWFDYDVDSDEEWEEEEPGESLRGSDDEKDEENAEDDEYDVDNEFMVPHGYLSDEEAMAEEDEKEDMTPETQKYKLKLLGEEFEAEMNAKTSRLKPKIIGCIWQGPDNEFPESVPAKVVEYLSARKSWVHQIPIQLNNAPSNEAKTSSSPKPQPGRRKMKRLPEEAIPDLIKLIHGNTHGRGFLIKEFLTFLNKKNPDGQQYSKAGLGQKIREIARWMACPEEGPLHLKACWYVSEETRKQYLTEPLSLPNSWSYSLTPRRKSELTDQPEKSEKEDEKLKEKEKPREKEKRNVPLITQFTKKITPEELKRQMAPKPQPQPQPQPQLQLQPVVQSADQPVGQPAKQTWSQPAKPAVNQNAKQKTPKRAQLISVPRDKQLPKSSGESLLSKFINKMSKVRAVVDDDDVVALADKAGDEANDSVDSWKGKEKKPQKEKRVTFNMYDTKKEGSLIDMSKLRSKNNIGKEVRIILTPLETDK